MRTTRCLLLPVAIVLTIAGRGGGRSTGGRGYMAAGRGSGTLNNPEIESAEEFSKVAEYWHFAGSSDTPSYLPGYLTGLTIWDMLRNRKLHTLNVHVHGDDQNGRDDDSTTNDQANYHDTNRIRYTMRITPDKKTSEPGAGNILETTHYITDYHDLLYFTQGNMTCTSIFNAKSISEWYQKQVENFKKQYPLYRSIFDARSENFTLILGKIIHSEPVTITCCGSKKSKNYLRLLADGTHPDANCINHLGSIPIRELIFVRTEDAVNVTGGHETLLRDQNGTTPSTTL